MKSNEIESLREFLLVCTIGTLVTIGVIGILLAIQLDRIQELIKELPIG